MSERTIITTIEVKTTYKDVPKCFQLDKEQIANIQSIAIKRELNADDVVVTNVQEFDGGVEKTENIPTLTESEKKEPELIVNELGREFHFSYGELVGVF